MGGGRAGGMGIMGVLGEMLSLRAKNERDKATSHRRFGFASRLCEVNRPFCRSATGWEEGKAS